MTPFLLGILLEHCAPALESETAMAYWMPYAPWNPLLEGAPPEQPGALLPEDRMVGTPQALRRFVTEAPDPDLWIAPGPSATLGPGPTGPSIALPPAALDAGCTLDGPEGATPAWMAAILQRWRG